MSFLETIIQTFSQQEYREFKYLLNNHSNMGSGKMLKLLTLIRARETQNGSIIAKKLGQTPNAYQSLRAKLTKQIEQFTYIIQSSNNQTVRVMNYIMTAKYLLKNKKFKYGWKYLSKAEAIADQYKLNDLICIILSIKIENSDHLDSKNMHTAMDKLNTSLNFYEDDIATQITYYKVRKSIHEKAAKGQKINANQILSDLQIKPKIKKQTINPITDINITQGIFDTLVAEKKFKEAKIHLTNKYKYFIQHNYFNQNNHYKLLGILHNLTYIYFNTSNFEMAEQFAKETNKQLLNYNKMLYHEFPKRNIIYLSIYMFTNRLNKAIDLIDFILTNKQFVLSISDFFFIHMNQCSIFQFKEDYDKALNEIALVRLKEKEIIKSVGLEYWIQALLKEITLYFENGATQLAYNLITNVRKKYSSFFNDELNNHMDKHVRLLLKIIDTPNWKNNKHLLQEIKAMTKAINLSKDYGIWFKSKLENKKYYDVFLETVNPKSIF